MSNINQQSILELVYYPQSENKLRQQSQEIERFDASVNKLSSAMLETMEEHQGIGLAAPQVGVLNRLFVMKIPEFEHLPKVFVNPKIIEKTDELMEFEEGCLSIPEYRAKISRPKFVKIDAFDAKGKPFEVDLEGVPAICAQHEIDHLNGILFIDYLSRLKRMRLKKKMLKEL
jgi:peptide deformylase